MSKRYEGVVTSQGGPQAVRVVEDGQPIRQLTHRMRHSPDGFQWGYGGSGPSDLARSIVWDAIGREPEPGCYQAFKFAYVAGWGDEWQIDVEEVRRFVHAWRAEREARSC